MFLFFAVGLALMFVAVVIGWKLSRPKLDSKPIVAATPTPAPEAPPEKPSVTSAERQEVLEWIKRCGGTADGPDDLREKVRHARA